MQPTPGRGSLYMETQYFLLKIIADYLMSSTNITGFIIPSIITAEQRRADIVVID